MLKLYGTLAVLAAVPTLSEQPAKPVDPAIPAVICHAPPKDDPKDAPIVAAKAILTGYGTGGFKVAANPEAQAYFDNGMQLAHAFAHRAATAAFMRAEELDPTCAMCAWGEAWSRGPTINFGIDDKERKEAAALADKAARLGRGGSPKERALIAAVQKRYREQGGDEAFARAMDDIAKAYPDDNEIAVLAADAWMIPAAHNDTTDHLDRATALLDGVLARNPNDTGAIHFYIHVTEFDHVGTKALPYALKLQALAPDASHLVHMPSHTYFWAGRYRMAEQSNLDAVEIDKKNAERLKPKDGVFGLSYHGHNVQYGEAAALLDGDAKGGLALASAELGTLARAKPDEPYAQVTLSTAYFVYGRLGSSAEIDALPQPGAKLPYAQAMWRYAKGEAAVRRGDLGAVKAEAAALRMDGREAKGLKDFRPRAESGVEVARLVLTGRAAMLEQRFGEAETAYRRAADLQDSKFGHGGDPPMWWYPVRRSLSAALLAEGKTADAEREIQAVLARWPYDPVSLRIASDCAAKSGRPDEAKRLLEHARANWTGDVAALPISQL